MKKFIIIFCLTIILLQSLQIAYAKRALFVQNYDVKYWQDRFEHSQWVLPLSQRTIGDDGLYAYMGYNLINGGNIAGFNSEMPPLGKYLIGLSIKIFDNSLYSSVIFGFGSLIIFYLISLRLLNNKVNAIFLTTLLFLDPLFFSQFWQSMLDIYQLFFLLIHILFIIKFIDIKNEGDNKRLLYASLSGLSLGLFAEVKFPILLPLILIIESSIMLIKKAWREYLIYLISIFFAILAVNIRFFLDGNSIIHFLKLQKYILSFYSKSNLIAHKEAIWQVLSFGKFPGITNGSVTNVGEWWLLWPAITLLGTSMAIVTLFSKAVSFLNKGLAVFLLASLAIFTLIPSYPRYLVIVLPFMYFFTIIFLQRFSGIIRMIFYVTLLVLGLINSFFFLLPKPDNMLNGFYYNLSHLYFHDVYQENVAEPEALHLTRSQFRYIANTALSNAGVKEIEVKELSRSISMFASSGSVKVGLTYKTQDLGSFYEEKIIKLIKINEEWKIDWDWNTILNGFKLSYEISSQIILGKRGSIFGKNGFYKAKDYDGYLVSVNPEKIDLTKEHGMLQVFSNLGHRLDVDFQNAYLENVLPNSYVPLFTPNQSLSQEDKQKLLSYPGTILTPHESRVFDGIDGIDGNSIDNTFYKERNTRIYSSFSYHGIAGLEKEYDSILWGYSGGKIIMKDDKGAIIRVVFAKDKRDGKDVVLQ